MCTAFVRLELKGTFHKQLLLFCKHAYNGALTYKYPKATVMFENKCLIRIIRHGTIKTKQVLYEDSSYWYNIVFLQFHTDS